MVLNLEILQIMNQFVYQDNNLSIDEKKELINNLNNLNREILNKMQGKMMIKYDFGYFLSDLSKIFELPFSNMNSIKNNHEPETNIYDAFCTIKLVEFVIKSHELNKWIKV